MRQSSEIKTLLEQLPKDFKEEIVHHRYLEPEPAKYSEPENPIEENLEVKQHHHIDLLCFMK